MKKNVGLKRFFEISIILVIVFAVIMIMFGVLNLGFKFLYKTISGNAVSEEVPDSLRNFDWIIITAITAFSVVYTLEKFVKKGFIKIKFD